MYELDIKLNKDGDTVIENGEFKLTDTDADFIYRMLITTPGSWSFYEELGVGLEKFIGEQNNEKTRKNIRETTKSFFKNFGFFPEMTVLPVDDYSIVCSMVFYVLGNTETISAYFSFSLENGIVKFYTEVEDDYEFNADTSQLENEQTINKYLKRRIK